MAQPLRGPDGNIQVFGWRYLPAHAVDMFLTPPQIELDLQGFKIGGGARTAVWFGTPMALLIFWDIRRWWGDPVRRSLMLSTLPVILILLLYHGPMIGSVGYYRYTLDFLIIWLAVVSPYAVQPGRKRWTFIMLAWSVFYYYMLTLPQTGW